MLVIKNEIATRFLAVFLLGFVLFAAIHGILMDDSIKKVQAVQTGSDTIQTESETKTESETVEEQDCDPMEVPEGVNAPVDGISLAPVSHLFGDMVGTSSLERSTVISSLKKLQTTLLEYMGEKKVPDCILDEFESSLHSAIVLFQEELITREQFKSEVRGILDTLRRNIYYGVPIDALVNIGVPRTLVEKYADKVLEEKDVDISQEELVEAARNITGEE